MKKIPSLGYSVLAVVCLFLYALIDLVEQVVKNLIIAYMNASMVNFSNDIVQFSLKNSKLMFIILAAIFFILTTIGLFQKEEIKV